jgi:hypothetical protein
LCIILLLYKRFSSIASSTPRFIKIEHRMGRDWTNSRSVDPWTLDDVEREKHRLTCLWSVRAHEAQVRGEDVPMLELPSDQELLQRTKRDRDFRVCEHCSSSSEQTWKLRNQDFNGAINILTILMAELSGEERPTYLCPERKKRRATFGTRKRRIAQNCCFGYPFKCPVIENEAHGNVQFHEILDKLIVQWTPAITPANLIVMLHAASNKN